LSRRVAAAVALGSNLGDRRAHLEYGASSLRALLAGARLSRFFETVPVAVSARQPLFLNAAVVGDTTLPPERLLDALLEIEKERGRERPFPGAPRTLDLDLVLYGDEVIDGPALSVPHPRFRERLFVLEPLAEVAPDLRDPVTGKTIQQLLTALRGF
jgi:2-amino-4-hydroxy-6-hydroxymethyldihydropteridine diphosphokinase